jgi:hypothetical protein
LNSTAEQSILNQLSVYGYTWIPSALSADECVSTGQELDRVLATSTSSLRDGTHIYGARNLLDVFPRALEWVAKPSIAEACEQILGPDWGVVRGLYFDKPPGGSWSLAWHQDLTIAVGDNRISSTEFTHPTRKAGVGHFEAPTWLLKRMLTLRFHLDPMLADNGPLLVQPGSHLAGKLVEGEKPSSDEIRELHCDAGDCLLMRPLLSHSSRLSADDCPNRRRIVHLELTGCKHLPDGIRWHRYIPRTRYFSR